ncbi:hypothetical protein HM131_13800 [Halobacillus mangrovi]|uniref:Uncharacterized protein n=1 Tax=Halobacillus mangrovi TaxID=402384 RepID=A0A1W5ZWZ6_9BACI|nr:hypothetical protein HM131_13800 [Halobacillus mangrovi]
MIKMIEPIFINNKFVIFTKFYVLRRAKSGKDLFIVFIGAEVLALIIKKVGYGNSGIFYKFLTYIIGGFL